MLRVRYNLTKKSQSVSPISISVSWNGNRVQKSINQSINPKFWDYKKCRLKSSQQHAVLFNNYLNELEKCIIDFYNENISFNRNITETIIKEKIESVLSNGVKKENKNLSVVEVFDKFMEVYRNDGKKPKAKTMEGYVNTRNKLFRYQREKRTRLQFEDINHSFYQDFVESLYRKNNTAATIGTNISKLITFMNWTKKNQYHNTNDYLDFKVLKGEPLFTIVLTEEELNKIQKLKINNPDIEFARLFLIVNCNIGLRFSDLMEVIKEYSIISNELRIRQVKTNAIIRLPIGEYVKEMIIRLKSLYRQGIDRKIINAGLKEVGKLALMNDIETSIKLIGNKRITVEKYRWELLSTHVGRRTFATRAAEKSVPFHIIMKYTGHKNLSTLQKYIKSSSFDSNEIIEGLWN